MANVLSYIEQNQGSATPESLLVLNRAREIASAYGASVYAVLPCTRPPAYGDNDVVAVLSRHGADKIVLAAHPQLSARAFYATHGEALKAVCRQLQPRLMLFPDSSGARDLAPRIAMCIGAEYLASVRIACNGSDPQLQCRVKSMLRVFEATLRTQRHQLVLTVATTEAPVIVGDDDAEVMVVHAPAESSPGLSITEATASAAREAIAPSVLIVAGAGMDQPGDLELLDQLAHKLSGRLVATESACRLGIAPMELSIAALANAAECSRCIVFAASGSGELLHRLGLSCTLLAVNRDRHAPIFRVADHGIIGDGRATARELVDTLAQASEALS